RQAHAWLTRHRRASPHPPHRRLLNLGVQECRRSSVNYPQMHLKQFYLGCLAHASYLVADPAAGLAAVVDPQRDIEIYLEEAARLHVRIRYVFLTHFHADFLAGHLE